MNKKRIILIILGLLLVFGIGFGIYKLFDNSDKEVLNTAEYDYKIIYQSGYYVYNFMKKDDMVVATKNELVACSGTDNYCGDTILISEYAVDFNDEAMRRVYDLFDELFKNTDDKEIIIDKADVSEEQLHVINGLVYNDSEYFVDEVGDNSDDEESIVDDNDDETIISDNHDEKVDDEVIVTPPSKSSSPVIEEETISRDEIEYEVVNTSTTCNLTNQGFNDGYINGKYRVTISMGRRNTGGYSITVSSVLFNDKNATIYVNEKIPAPNEYVTQAFTTPCVVLEFSEKPDSITVINIKTRKEYNKTTPEGDMY